MKFEKYWKWLLLAVLLAIYANHFDNSFHFDDSHTIVNNPAIRDLSQVGRFYTDGSLFSVLPANQGWRPLLSTTLAFDYWLAGGLKPWAFHLDSFGLFLLHVVAVYYLYLKALPSRRWAALGTAVFALHPVMAETVNYLIQRGDLLASLGCTVGLALYGRGNRLYPLGFLIAGLGKPNGVVFPLLLTWWMLWIERRWRWSSWIGCGVLGVGLALLHRQLTPPSYTPGGASAHAYWWTQPYVMCSYVLNLLWPGGLVADTDLAPFASPWEGRAVLGYLGLGLLLGVLLWASRRAATQPIAFGLAWFFTALLPTALIPLAEVTNDHRMFFAFVGLILALIQALALLPESWRRSGRPILWVALAGLAWGTYGRNQVWHSEETLWKEVTRKAPGNGRGWMNYGLALMGKADWERARTCFAEAARLSPTYPLVFVNIGILESSTGRRAEAEAAFARARSLAPQQPDAYFYEARWRQHEEPARALDLLEQALRARPGYPQAQELLLELGVRQRDWPRLERWNATLRPSPAWQERIRTEQARERQLAEAMPASAQRYVQLGFVEHKLGHYTQALQIAGEGLRRYPQDAELLNNQAAAYMALKRWPEAARAAEAALRRRPDWALARNNLNYARAQMSRR